MQDPGRKTNAQLFCAEPTTAADGSAPPQGAAEPPVSHSSELAAVAAIEQHQPQLAGALQHPVVLVDPRPLTWLAIRSYRRQRIPIHVFSEHALDPTLYARGVSRHRLPRMNAQPRQWYGRLLELAARIEPRPVLVPCSQRALDLLYDQRDTLQAHFEIAHLEALELQGYDCADFRSERALHRTVVRGEPAFEVQVTLDSAGNCNAACVLTWMAGVPPHLVVTSVEGHEILERSLEWLRARRVRGYARLIWSPDRFGRVDLQSAGTLPGSGWVLAMEDGVDFPLMAYASLAGTNLPAQFAARQLSRQVRVAKIDAHALTAPLIALQPPAWRQDPVARLVSLLGSVLGFDFSEISACCADESG